MVSRFENSASFILVRYQNYSKFVDLKYTKRPTDLRTVGILMSPMAKTIKESFAQSLHCICKMYDYCLFSCSQERMKMNKTLVKGAGRSKTTLTRQSR